MHRIIIILALMCHVECNAIPYISRDGVYEITHNEGQTSCVKMVDFPNDTLFSWKPSVVRINNDLWLCMYDGLVRYSTNGELIDRLSYIFYPSVWGNRLVAWKQNQHCGWDLMCYYWDDDVSEVCSRLLFRVSSNIEAYYVVDEDQRLWTYDSESKRLLYVTPDYSYVFVEQNLRPQIALPRKSMLLRTHKGGYKLMRYHTDGGVEFVKSPFSSYFLALGVMDNKDAILTLHMTVKFQYLIFPYEDTRVEILSLSDGITQVEGVDVWPQTIYPSSKMDPTILEKIWLEMKQDSIRSIPHP